MNKKDKKNMDKWLNILSKKLSGLKSLDRKDIIENYKDLWNEEFSQGKSANEILLGLRSINEIAKEFYEEFGIIKNHKGEVTKIKIVNSKTESTTSFFKEIKGFFIKTFGLLYSITAILISITLFLTFVAIIVAIPVALVLAFINFEFLVVLPLAIGVMGIGVIVSIFLFFLSSSSYYTVKAIFYKWFTKESLISKDKKKNSNKIMLCILIIAGSMGGVGAITSTVGNDSIYGSIISGNYLNKSENEIFNLEQAISDVFDGKENEFNDNSNIYIDFNWSSSPWSIFEINYNQELLNNTLTIEKNFNFKQTLGDQFVITQNTEKNYWNKNTNANGGSLYLNFNISAPWNAKFLSITPIKYKITYNFTINGVQAKKVFVRF
ncbi:DUF1700 domain-containing protein [Mesoplasma chauliocola]|uniref:DUF1700 domain-containing protein n=1 Tax=Mesoplasma chauliocola TaxID=216427 RepID=A0A249SN33_9MOLU|nr:DUF1700 domain-containing protein [Mesoplasma chauliocola]ASZ09085.1 DUF1700 domain-containing protein [Mesoplasma chauliocola]